MCVDVDQKWILEQFQIRFLADVNRPNRFLVKIIVFFSAPGAWKPGWTWFGALEQKKKNNDF